MACSNTEGVCKVYKKSYDLDRNLCRFYSNTGTINLDLKDGNVIGIWREQVKNELPITIVGDEGNNEEISFMLMILLMD